MRKVAAGLVLVWVLAGDRAGFLAGVRILVRVFASPPVAVLSLILVAYQLLNQRERSQLHA
jgi:hypothetical protein